MVVIVRVSPGSRVIVESVGWVAAFGFVSRVPEVGQSEAGRGFVGVWRVCREL